MSLLFLFERFVMQISWKHFSISGEADDCIRFMVRVNNMGEWMWQMYMRLVLGGMFIITLMATLCSILFTWYITGQLKYNACFLYRPFKMT